MLDTPAIALDDPDAQIEAIRARHPTASEEEVLRQARVALLGEALTTAAYRGKKGSR